MRTELSTHNGPISTPYSIQLPSPLADGQTITAKVHMVESEDSRISFNIGENVDFQSGVLFHFDIRFDENVVVRNSKIDTEWGEEERDGEMPLTKGEAFDISFVVTSTHYEVFVKGTKFCDYKYRMPIEKAKYFFVRGIVEIDSIKFTDMAGKLKENLEVPYQVPISLYDGRKMYMSGIAPKDSDSWSISLIVKEEPEEESCGALIFNPRFQNYDDNNIVVLNSKENGKWQAEERPEGMPFILEQFCNVTIEVEADKYKIAVNDEPYCEFKHRMDFKLVTSLKIDGKINLKSVHI